jgi:threonine dehydrogenase-like Zn-dependent dehydrogenase
MGQSAHSCGPSRISAGGRDAGRHPPEVGDGAFAAGLGDHRIVTTLCPGGKERMRRLIATVESGRFDPLPLITHRFGLDDIVKAYDLFSNRRDGVLKVVILP